MVQKKCLEGLEPYNDLFYVHCLYNSLFAILKYYKKSILPILLNSVVRYEYSNDGVVNLSFSYLPELPLQELLSTMGIKINSRQNNDVITDIIGAINKGNPVIMNIDCYFMPVRPEFYLTRHWSHVILIYGYDNAEKTFQIIEQRHFESLTYDKMDIKYDNLIEAYRGYLDMYCINDETKGYNEYELMGDVMDKSDDIRRYIGKYKEKNSKSIKAIKEGQEQLERFILDYDSIFLDEMNLRQNCDILLSGLNNIVNGKKVQKFLLQSLFGDEHDLVKLTVECENNWALIRSRLARYKFSSMYRKKDFLDMQTVINTIFRAEESFYNIVGQL